MNKRAPVFIMTALWSGQSVAQTPAPIGNTDLSKDAKTR